MPKYPGISPYDNEKGTLGTAKKRWEKLYVKEIESDTVSGINASIENLATTATNSVSAAVSAKNDAVAAKTAAEAAQTAAETAAAGIQSVVETDVDNTLSIAGVAADAKVTGDWLRDIAKPVTLDTSMPATAYADEYMKVTTDSEGRVLYGVKRDGTFTWQKGTPRHVIEACNPTMDNPEWLYLIKDPEDKVVFGIKRDGSVSWPKGTPQHVIEACNPTIESDEFVQIIQDSDGRIIEGVLIDGTKKFASPVRFSGGVKWTEKNVIDFYAQKTSLSHKLYSVMGDSISVFREDSEQYGESYYYPNGNVVSLNDMWWKKVADSNKLEFLSTGARSGSLVCGESSAESSNAGCSDRRIALLGANGKSPDIILVLIGTNDYGAGKALGNFNENSDLPSEGDIEDFSSAYALMLYKMKVAYPRARIFCGSIVPRVPGAMVYPYKNSAGLTIPQYNNVIKMVCNIMNATFVDIWDCGINDKNIADYTVDGHLHPNAGGMSLIASCFNRAIWGL